MNQRRRALTIILGGIVLIAGASAFSMWVSAARSRSLEASIVICHGCPSPHTTHQGPNAFTETNWRTLLARPMRPPKLAPGAGCPLTHGDDRYIDIAVNGPATPPIAGQLGALRMTVGPQAEGPVVIRAAQVDGPGAAIFDLINPPQGDFRMPPLQTHQIGQFTYPSILLLALPTEHFPGEYFPSYFIVDMPGCYYIQVDGLRFGYIVTFSEV